MLSGPEVPYVTVYSTHDRQSEYPAFFLSVFVCLCVCVCVCACVRACVRVCVLDVLLGLSHDHYFNCFLSYCI